MANDPFDWHNAVLEFHSVYGMAVNDNLLICRKNLMTIIRHIPTLKTTICVNFVVNFFAKKCMNTKQRKTRMISWR